MMTAIAQFIKECKKSILALIVIVAVVFIGCYIYTLQAENNSYKNHLQSAKDENRQLLDEKKQLVNSFKDQLQSIKDTNQQLFEEKQKKNDQINAELQSIKDNNQKLLEKNKELQKKVDQINAELQSVKGNNHKLLEENKELQKKVNQINAELQSVKGNSHKLLEENKELQKKVDQINAELQSVKGNSHKLLEENKELQKKVDQINAELQSVKGNNQKVLEETQRQNNQLNTELQSTKESNQEALEEKIRLLEKLNQINSEREVYSTQVMYIQKWMEPIEKLEEHIYAVIYCSESKKGTKYSKPEMCTKISYDFEESDTSKIITTAIDLIMKFKKECSLFWDALSLKKVEEMKALQALTPLGSFKSKMEQFNEEVSGYKYQKKTEKKDLGENNFDEHHQWNQEKGAEKEGILSTIYKFGKWVGSVIFGLFWS